MGMNKSDFDREWLGAIALVERAPEPLDDPGLTEQVTHEQLVAPLGVVVDCTREVHAAAHERMAELARMEAALADAVVSTTADPVPGLPGLYYQPTHKPLAHPEPCYQPSEDELEPAEAMLQATMRHGSGRRLQGAPRGTTSEVGQGWLKPLRGVMAGQVATTARNDRAAIKVRNRGDRLAFEDARHTEKRTARIAAGTAEDMSRPFDMDAHRAKQARNRRKRGR